MDKTLLVRITKVFGNKTIYPANDAADLFTRIAGTVTLTANTIRYAEKLGYEVVVQQQTL